MKVFLWDRTWFFK